MKMLAMFLLSAIVVLASGCATNMVDANIDRAGYLTLYPLAYDEAYVTKSALVVKYRAGYVPNAVLHVDKSGIPMKATYNLSDSRGLPLIVRAWGELKAPANATSVPIVVVPIPELGSVSFNDRLAADPRVATNMRPLVVVASFGAGAPDGVEPDSIDSKHFITLCFPANGRDRRADIQFDSPELRLRSKSLGWELLKPFAVLFDVVTFPIQLPFMIYIFSQIEC